MRGRDSQRQKLYDAERLAKLDDRPMTLWECEVYAKNVMAWAVSAGLNQTGRRSAVTVRAGNRTRATCRWTGTWLLTFPKWAQTRWVVIHECCHGLAPRDTAAHGWQFAAAYLRVVEQFLGVDSAKRLKDAFKKCGVRYRAPISRPISPERRAQLVAQLAACRAARQQPSGT